MYILSNSSRCTAISIQNNSVCIVYIDLANVDTIEYVLSLSRHRWPAVNNGQLVNERLKEQVPLNPLINPNLTVDFRLSFARARLFCHTRILFPSMEIVCQLAIS